MRYYIDTEFAEKPYTIEMISIGIVAEDGREFYAESSEIDPANCNEWVQQNVLTRLTIPPEQRKTRQEIGQDVIAFIGDDQDPKFFGWYCVAPDTKVLTENLKWVRADSLRVGDGLIGFDEQAPPGKGRSSKWRAWRRSQVERTEIVQGHCFELEFNDGTKIRCTSDHRWLISNQDGVRWTTTEKLLCHGKKGSNVVKPIDVWEEHLDYETGYLAAALDGEGHLSQDDLAASGRNGQFCFRLGFTQKDNAMLSYVISTLEEKDFRIGAVTIKPDVCNTILINNREDVIRFLGSVRPKRLLAKFDPGAMGAMSLRTVKLVRKTDIGIQPVVSMKTTTGTFIAEGLASHNCDYDWVCTCWLFGSMVDLPENFPKYCYDLKQELDRLGNRKVPFKADDEHNALSDARWNRKLHRWIGTLEEKEVFDG